MSEHAQKDSPGAKGAVDARLPVAIIGAGGFGEMTLTALKSSSVISVVGISDRDPNVAQRVGSANGVPSFNDNRSLLEETRPKAVYLAVPPMHAGELVLACAERGIHVLKEMPLARNLGEAASLVERMEKAGLKFAVGTQRRFGRGYERACQLRGRLGEVFLARSHYFFNWGPNLNWRGDRQSAGGGALLELGYHPIDLLVWMLGLPDEVYGATAGGNRPAAAGEEYHPAPLYDTDDTSAAILRYVRGIMATVVTTRASGPVSEELNLHGRGGSLSANTESCLLRDPDGNVLDRTRDESAPLDLFRRQAEAFASAIINNSRTYACSAKENLLNQSVIEALYLSDKTCQPENPTRLLKTHGLTPQECLQYQPMAPAEEK
jgi:predicted dehydrogenase